MDEEKTGRIVEYLVGESLYLTLLSRLLAKAPSPELLKGIVTDALLADMPFAREQPSTVEGLRLVDEWATNCASESVNDVQADHFRLFIGVGMPTAPLWESAYFGAEGNLVFQKETLLVRDWYRRYGLQVRDLHHDPDDNLAYELEFMAELATCACKAFEAGNEAEGLGFVAAQAAFLDEHPYRWAFEWCTMVQSHAKTKFYRGVAKLVAGALEELTDTKSRFSL
jgi:TorA maturation chaperone TorD